MKITVYTQPGCQPCRVTMRALLKYDLEFDVVDVTRSPKDADALLAQGFTGTPVVEVDTGDGNAWMWQGFNLDNIKHLASVRDSRA